MKPEQLYAPYPRNRKKGGTIIKTMIQKDHILKPDTIKSIITEAEYARKQFEKLAEISDPEERHNEREKIRLEYFQRIEMWKGSGDNG